MTTTHAQLYTLQPCHRCDSLASVQIDHYWRDGADDIWEVLFACHDHAADVDMDAHGLETFRSDRLPIRYVINGLPHHVVDGALVPPLSGEVAA